MILLHLLYYAVEYSQDVSGDVFLHRLGDAYWGVFRTPVDEYNARRIGRETIYDY